MVKDDEEREWVRQAADCGITLRIVAEEDAPDNILIFVRFRILLAGDGEARQEYAAGDTYTGEALHSV